MAGEIQTNVNVTIVAAPETSFGVPALANSVNARTLRRVSSSLTGSKDSYTSAEVRSDQQVADMRHGTRRAGGGIESELFVGAYDPEIEAVMRGTWTATAATSNVEYGTVVANAAASTLVFSTGDPVTNGYRVGDVVRLTGAAVSAANKAINFRIKSFGGINNRTVTVSPPPVDMPSVAAFGFVLPGRKVLNGKVKRSFTLEQIYEDIDLSEIFNGCRIGGASFRLPPTGTATVSFDYQGINFATIDPASAPYFMAPAEPNTTGAVAAVDGALRINGVDVAVVTGLDFAIALGLSSTPVVGSNFVPDIFYSRTIVTGTFTAFLKDRSLIDLFDLEREFEAHGLFQGPPTAGSTVPDFLAFSMQRCKITGQSKTIGADGGVIISFPFQALIHPGLTGSGYDRTTLAIQRSNAT